MEYTSSSQYRIVAGQLITAHLPATIVGITMGYVTVPGFDMLDDIRTLAPFYVDIYRKRFTRPSIPVRTEYAFYLSPRMRPLLIDPNSPKVLIGITFTASTAADYSAGIHLVCHLEEAWDFLCGIDGIFAEALAIIMPHLGQWSNRKPARLPVVLKAVRAELRRAVERRNVSDD
jgi:hypothetical protein